MDKKEKHITIKEVLEKADRIALLPSSIAGVDAFCAGVGLYHMLKNKEKKVSLIYPWKLPDTTENIIDKSEIITDVRQRELVVSIDYAETFAEKVQYSTDNGVFVLKIGPVHKDFDHITKVRSELRGHSHDVFITIGAQALDDFGYLYNEMTKEITLGRVINLDIHSSNTYFGHHNVVDSNVSSLSQMALDLAPRWNLKVPKEAAAAILHGIMNKSGL